MVSARWCLAAIFLLLALAGATSGILGGGSADNERVILIAAAVPLYALTYLWMKADSRERATPPPPGAIPLVVLAFVVAVPYYLLGTRRGWRKLQALALLVGFVVASAFAFAVASYAGTALAT